MLIATFLYPFACLSLLFIIIIIIIIIVIFFEQYTHIYIATRSL
jgi:hypothetical protein